jgi:hypothetical protein
VTDRGVQGFRVSKFEIKSKGKKQVSRFQGFKVKSKTRARRERGNRDRLRCLPGCAGDLSGVGVVRCAHDDTSKGKSKDKIKVRVRIRVKVKIKVRVRVKVRVKSRIKIKVKDPP